ncbi:N-acetylmuramoyl-L-alanine amidase [Desulfoplanes sp.]
MDTVTRRRFLRAGSLGLATAMVAPGLVFARETAFDLALEGQDLMAAKKYMQAIKSLRKAVDMDAGNEWVWGLLGRAYYQLGEMRYALTSFRKVININPDDVYSRMMIEVIMQKPLPPKKKDEGPLTPLEREAKEEEAHFRARFKENSDQGYHVRRLVLDAGHGGFDSGAVGLNKLEEKNVTLDLVKRTAAILGRQNRPFELFMTRTDDYYIPLSARTTTANQYNADLFVSFHINANANRKPNGIETYFCSEKASSKEARRVAAFENSVVKFDKKELVKKGYVNIEDMLFRFERRRYWEAAGSIASIVQQRMAQDVDMRNRGVHSANFYVLRRAKMPSILLETGFISNPDQERLLMKPSYRQSLAETIAVSLAQLASRGV